MCWRAFVYYCNLSVACLRWRDAKILFLRQRAWRKSERGGRARFLLLSCTDEVTVSGRFLIIAVSFRILPAARCRARVAPAWARYSGVGIFYNYSYNKNAQSRVSSVALVDACASWWTHGAGHGNPGMALAIAEAAGRYGHVIFPGNIHAPALEVSKILGQYELLLIFFGCDSFILICTMVLVELCGCEADGVCHPW